MINVLYVIWSLGLGGAEQVVMSLARGLDKSRFRPFIACLNDEGRFAEELKKEGITVFALNKVKGIDFSVVPKLVKIIHENNIQIVHTHLWGANFWGRFAAKAAKVPVVVTEHNVDVWKSPFHFWIDRFLFKKTDCFIAVSETVRDFYAQKLGLGKEKIRVVYNGIESCEGRRTRDEGRKKLKEDFGIKSDEKVIAVIGRLVPQKGHFFFLEAFSRMLKSPQSTDHSQQTEDKNYRLSTIDYRLKVLIVGDGPLEESLKLKVKSEKLENLVMFTGFRKDVAGILSITDVLVLPSSREGLPMILLEAMAAGVIVVATRVGGTPELVEDRVSGFLVEYGDVEGLAEKLQQVLKTPACRTGREVGRGTIDDGRWKMEEGREYEGREDDRTKDEKDLNIEKIRLNAKKIVEERFSLAMMIREHERIYSELLRGTKG